MPDRSSERDREDLVTVTQATTGVAARAALINVLAAISYG